MTGLYDRLGAAYDTTRRADPRIVARLAAHLDLEPGAPCLDLGCGSGNYTAALAARGLAMAGIDRSPAMLAAARAKGRGLRLVAGDAARLPFADGAFAGAVSTLASHHFADRGAAFAEVARVLRPGARFVLLTATAEQMAGYWLGRYFPSAIARAAAQMGPRETTLDALRAGGLGVLAEEPFAVPDDLADLFLYAGKRRPEIYLDARVRAGISTFAELCEPAELGRGLARLRADLAAGRRPAAADDSLGDYLFIVAGH